MKTFKKIYAVRESKGQSFWTPVGIAAVNKDNSMNLIFNLVPTDWPNTTLQVRDMPKKDINTSEDTPEALDT